MKYLNYISVSLMLMTSMTFNNCSEDFLDTAPSQSASDVTMSSSLDNLYIALNGIHREMVSQESGNQSQGGEPGFIICRDVCGDDITWEGSGWYKSSFLAWGSTILETSGYNSNYWTIYYQWILNANKLLEGLNIAPNNDQTLYNQIKGEALCIRAWAHFGLVQLYANRFDAGSDNSQPGVPYRQSSSTTPLARSSVAETYEYINRDLDEACTLLQGIEVNAVNHYSEMVAWGLKSRVALAMQDYANAAIYAGNSIELAKAEGLQLMEGDQLFDGFADITSKSKEAMYAAMTLDDQSIYFYSYYAFMSWNFSASAIRGGVKCINADTYDTMSDTDLRLAWWDPTGEMEVPSTSYKKVEYQNRKFTSRSNASAVGDFAFMRLAEIYLNQAEALARSNQMDAAKSVFNEFQVTRDPSYTGSTATSSDDLVLEIMNSRRIELWGEGFRFTDLKRLDEPLVRGRNFVLAFCGFLSKQPGEKGWTWEIPLSETDYNPLCVKNY